MPKSKIGYVDGFVLVVPKGKVAAYKKMATGGAKLWMKYGALDYKECVADDIAPHSNMKFLLFSKMTKLKRGETVFFSYIGYKSRAHRDAVNTKVMAEMQKYENDPAYKETPFDMKRMAYGGFKVLVG